jgi:1,4-alpha-glucan branching enzyme
MAKKKCERSVTFVCEFDPFAKQVFIAGDFNEWNPTNTRMVKRHGTFRRRLDITPGEHQYKFIVDGRWQTDPAAAMQIPNGIGSLNSVLNV